MVVRWWSSLWVRCHMRWAGSSPALSPRPADGAGNNNLSFRSDSRSFGVKPVLIWLNTNSDSACVSVTRKTWRCPQNNVNLRVNTEHMETWSHQNSTISLRPSSSRPHVNRHMKAAEQSRWLTGGDLSFLPVNATKTSAVHFTRQLLPLLHGMRPPATKTKAITVKKRKSR